MSKRFKNKICVYCNERKSQEGDHIFARKFFLKTQRSNLPQVPACKKCNNSKSILEHYLTTILPFGGRHTTALEYFKKMIPKRLNKNIKLKKRLSKSMQDYLIQQNDGQFKKQTGYEIKKNEVTKLFEFIVKGLYFHHCGSILEQGAYIRVIALTKAGEEHFHTYFFSKKEHDHFLKNLGEGSISYEGAFDRTSRLSWWAVSMYGGIQLADTKRSDGHAEVSEKMGIVTVPPGMIDRIWNKNA